MPRTPYLHLVEIGHIIEPLSRNGVKTKGITHNHDTMLTIQRHLEASDRLDFDQSARDKVIEGFLACTWRYLLTYN